MSCAESSKQALNAEAYELGPFFTRRRSLSELKVWMRLAAARRRSRDEASKGRETESSQCGPI